ncbi:MAG: FoF1 ATP synthase subunit gamma [Eubacteriales bacterium]
MPSMRELKNHIKSIKTTWQLADAIKSISTARYYRVSRLYKAFEVYAGKSYEMLGSVTSPFGEKIPAGRKCFVLLTGNRGLCGGYNTTLAAYFEGVIKDEANPIIVVCGRWGETYFRNKHHIKIEKQFIFADVPEYSEGSRLGEYLTELYESGGADEVIFVFQKYKNLLSQIPSKEVFLPVKTDEKAKNPDAGVYYPDRETAEKSLYANCLKNKAYSFLLEWASGAQAATMMAMRNASDSARELKLELDLRLSRRRQWQVTSGVIETASSNELINKPKDEINSDYYDDNDNYNDKT